MTERVEIEWRYISKVWDEDRPGDERLMTDGHSIAAVHFSDQGDWMTREGDSFNPEYYAANISLTPPPA